MKKLDPRSEKNILWIVSIGFVLWSAVFIYRSSFIAVDGRRYFSLFDDAMISMRYAWNFSHGLGLVWNSGEYVQGYTNLLMTLLMSLATHIFNKPIAVLFIHAAGVGFMLGIAFVSMKIADHLVQNESHQLQTLIRIFSFLCALSYYPLAYWSLMGMETGLLTLLFLLGLLAALDYSRNNKPILLLISASSLGLAYLTRNDSLIFAILIWFYLILDAIKSNADQKGFRLLLLAIGLYILFVIGQAVFNYSYYGEVLPNTYTLKLTGMPFFTRIKNGFGFVNLFLVETSSVLLLSSIDLVFDFRKQKLLLLSTAFAAIGYQIYVGGDPWAYWRIMSPTMPLILLLCIYATASIVDAILKIIPLQEYFLRNPVFSKKYINFVLITMLVIAGMLLVNIRFLPQISMLGKPPQAEDNQLNVNTAIVLNQLTTNDASIGVFWAGSLPYYTDRRAIDFLGKSDRYIAHLAPDLSGAVRGPGMTSAPGHNKYDLNYSIKTLEPTYVQTFDWGSFAWGSQNISEWALTKYVKVEYEGISLYFIKDSPLVYWSKINLP